MPRQIHSDAMDLGDILSKEQIITDLQAGDRWQAIDELIKNLVSTGKIKAEHHDAIAAVVIFLGNITILLLGIPLLASKVDVSSAFYWWFTCTRELIHRIMQLI